MGYRISHRAEADILAILRTGWREFGADQAWRYHQALMDAFAFLAENPRAARIRSEWRQHPRAHPCGVHLIFYRIDGRNIVIQRIRHMREDWGR